MSGKHEEEQNAMIKRITDDILISHFKFSPLAFVKSVNDAVTLAMFDIVEGIELKLKQRFDDIEELAIVSNSFSSKLSTSEGSNLNRSLNCCRQ
jgi:hypothetical protein